jgi:hypothetical protein
MGQPSAHSVDRIRLQVGHDQTECGRREPDSPTTARTESLAPARIASLVVSIGAPGRIAAFLVSRGAPVRGAVGLTPDALCPAQDPDRLYLGITDWRGSRADSGHMCVRHFALYPMVNSVYRTEIVQNCEDISFYIWPALIS